MSQQVDEGSSVVEEVSGGVLIIDFGALIKGRRSASRAAMEA